MTAAGVPIDEHIFWILGGGAAVVTLATPVVLLLNRLGRMETKIAKIDGKVNWLLHERGWNGKPHEAATHS